MTWGNQKSMVLAEKQTWINGMELRAQKYVDNSNLTKEQIIYPRERIVSLTNGVGKSRQPHTQKRKKEKKRNDRPLSHTINKN